ncbi:unnamed protein product [Caenorhabditis angaria]|uniref:Uncharacterized protein n=1 Tax=Caenorhabditis angaria TaxID=860376 RepID=A0A9P1N0D7_9PELO|nr:unnamed protein product [Caenorhabditis angaria]
MLKMFYVFQNFNNFILIIYLILSCARKQQKVCPVRHVGSSIQGSVTEADKSTATAKVLRKSTKSAKSQRNKKTKKTETVKSEPAPSSTVPEPTQFSTASTLAPLSTQLQTPITPTPRPSCGLIPASSRRSCNKLPSPNPKSGEAGSKAAYPISKAQSRAGSVTNQTTIPTTKIQSKAGSVNKTVALEPNKKSSVNLNQTV